MSGMPGNCKHLERAIALKGDRSLPEYVSALAQLAGAKRDILAYMDAFKLEGIVGGLGLSLVSAFCGAPIVRPFPYRSER